MRIVPTRETDIKLCLVGHRQLAKLLEEGDDVFRVFFGALVQGADVASQTIRAETVYRIAEYVSKEVE